MSIVKTVSNWCCVRLAIRAFCGALVLTGVIILGGGYPMASSTSDLMGGRLAHSVATGRLDGLEIEFWKGGGLPPPHYLSDQLRLMTQGDTEVVEFASLKWDDHFDPPNVQEKWIATVRSRDVHDIAQLMESTNFLHTAYSEETKPNIADCFSYEILLTYQGRQEKKKYYQK